MTHINNKGVERIEEELQKISLGLFSVEYPPTGQLIYAMTPDDANKYINNVIDIAVKALHQELQKAQESERERIKAFHEHECKKGDCTANNEGQWCCVEKYLRQSELDQTK